MQATIVTDQIRTVDAVVDGDQLLIDPAALPDAIGWELKPEGLCQGRVCVPVRDREALFVGDRVDVAAVAAAVGRLAVVDAAAGLAAIALPKETRRDALRSHQAPAFTLSDLDGAPHDLDEWRGSKKLLVTFATWCGCRYDLPGWQALHDELRDEGFTAIAVAMDETADEVRPFTEGITFPVLIDPEHLLSELYAISNVPTVVWIDENDRIVRPNGLAFGTDQFVEYHGVHSEPHLDLVRQWVRAGVEPSGSEAAPDAIADFTDDEVLARLHFRVAIHARRAGDTETAARHFERAGELAPLDFTVRRATLPLVGDDPFGATFFALYEEWKEAGEPYHGLPGVPA